MSSHDTYLVTSPSAQLVAWHRGHGVADDWEKFKLIYNSVSWRCELWGVGNGIFLYLYIIFSNGWADVFSFSSFFLVGVNRGDGGRGRFFSWEVDFVLIIFSMVWGEGDFFFAAFGGRVLMMFFFGGRARGTGKWLGRCLALV